jgi:hypothetical protein
MFVGFVENGGGENYDAKSLKTESVSLVTL